MEVRRVPIIIKEYRVALTRTGVENDSLTKQVKLMKFAKKAAFEWTVLTTLVTWGVATRLMFEEIPNFAPVSALALFAGFYFRSRTMAMVVPLSVMMISDSFLGGVDWRMRAVVYASLTAPIFVGGLMRWWMRDAKRTSTAFLNGLRGLPVATLFSVGFFVTTNLACWALWYPHSIEGLTRCYVNAIPFFTATLAGDLTFAFVLFTTYSLIRVFSVQRSASLAVS